MMWKYLCILLIFWSEVNPQKSCGVSKIGRGNIFFGSEVKHGQYPWMAAIMRRKLSGKFSFICGGSLISSRHVLTAAHCILGSINAPAALPRDIRVLLGMFDLDDTFETGRESISVEKIHIHDDWNPSTVKYDADIALIELEREITFTNYIQPICLLTSHSNLPENGIVVGYGLSEKSGNNHEKLPKMLELPMHSQEHCFLEEPRLAEISSRRTFCAGSGLGSGVCTGDSGGGFFIKINNVYSQRGIVSASLVTEGQCDVFNYAIFTNVLKFSDWINSKMSLARNYEECGVMSSSTGLIQGGRFSTLNDFPWVALIKLDQERHKSGALVSRKHVVASAASVSYWDEATAKFVNVALSRLKVHLGALQESSSREVFDPIKIVNNPQLNEFDGTRVNDVTVITLDHRVEFDEFIRPVCLWTFGDDLSLIANSPIYGVGYGRDETGEFSNIKKHAKVALEDQQKCEETYSDESNVFKATKTICIKGSQAGAPCSYDVHIFVKFNDKWFLRGNFLRAFVFPNNTCAVDYPYLYEDNAQHSNWIQTQIDT